MTATADFVADGLHVRVFDTVEHLASVAAYDAAGAIDRAIEERGEANVMFASGLSQVAFLDALIARPDVDWTRVAGFHMDEYVGMHAEHPASFRRYMRERIVARVHPAEFHELAGDAPDVDTEIARYTKVLRDHPLDLCCLGIGENGHLAFNDPHVADFDDPADVKVVDLDDRCRAQQVGEGHFPTIADVPPRALTVTIPALLRARTLVVVVPEARKAKSVHDALLGPVSTACPSSVLRGHAHATLYLDAESSSLLHK